jgi:hypothetical protein
MAPEFCESASVGGTYVANPVCMPDLHCASPSGAFVDGAAASRMQ